MNELTDQQRHNLARAVTEARGDRNWTQDELAEQAELAPRTIQNIESAKPKSIRATTAGALRKVFGWTPDELRARIDGSHEERSADQDDEALLLRAADLRAGRPLSRDDQQLLLRTFDAIIGRRAQ